MPTTKIPQDESAKTKPKRRDTRDRREYSKKWHRENAERTLECRRKYNKEHAEQIREYSRLYYKTHSEACCQAERKRRAEDIDKARERGREAARIWREKNPAKKSDWDRRWRENNPELVARNKKRHYEQNKTAYIQRAIGRRVLLIGTYTDADIAKLYENQNGLCNGCRNPLNGKFERDHIMPLALDPAGDRLDNLQLLCRPCNRSKRAMHPDQWAARIKKAVA